MFGKVISINDNVVIIQNNKGKTEANLLNIHLAFDEHNKKAIGEIISISDTTIKILLVGEINNRGTFTAGVIKKPTFTSPPRIVYKSELEAILGSQDISSKENLYFGNSTIYENYKVSANINDFFSNHFAVVGNTGSGKSCVVARILQNLFYHNDISLPENARIVLFDVYGEYNNAFSKLSNIGNIRAKSYTTKLDKFQTDIIKIPPHFLEVDDYALLLGANDVTQLPIIEQAIKLVYIFNNPSEQATNFKNDIIAKSVLDILSSGKPATQIRDQVIAVLTNYNTSTLNLETIIAQPGYNRTLKQCLNIDSQGKLNSVAAVVDFLSKYTEVDLDDIEKPENLNYSLDDLYYALEFALISEGAWSNNVVFEKANVLKVRLKSIINSNTKKIFEVDKYMNKGHYIQKLFKANDGLPAQIINLNFNYIDERLAKVLTKIFAKLFFTYLTNLAERGSYPIHMILEEAHRYVQIDNDVEILGYNIFDRITKEGRKYGMLLGFITQRPSELSTIALSQVSNFVVLRMFHPEDISIISSISSNVNKETITQIKSLHPGTGLVFGTAFKLPLIASFELPDPMPESTNVDITNRWY